MSSVQSFTFSLPPHETAKYAQNVVGTINWTYTESSNRKTSVHASISNGQEVKFDLNTEAKSLLYPNDIAKPIKADVSMSGCRESVLFVTFKARVAVYFNGNAVLYKHFSGTSTETETETNITSQSVTGSNKGTAITISLGREDGTGTRGVSIITGNITLYFTRYDFSAVAGTGVTSVSVSSSTGYDGDSVTFSCVLQSGYEFDGWYNGSTKVSSSQSYTHTVNGADLALTAKARQTVVTKSLSATYNGNQLQSFPLSVTAASSIVYNGVTTTVPFDGTAKTMLCGGKVMNGNAVIGGKTLQCANKLMATDVVVFILNNMLNLNSFSLSHVSVSGGVYAFQSNTTAMIKQDLPTPIAGHKYYGRCYQKAPSGSTFADGRFEYYQTDGATTNMTFCTMSDTVRDNNWHLHSAIRSLSTIGASSGWKLRSFTVSGTAESYRKEMLIVDLTNMFGAGNEPTKEWCDANLY